MVYDTLLTSCICFENSKCVEAESLPGVKNFVEQTEDVLIGDPSKQIQFSDFVIKFTHIF